jgi:hypothetical protein
MGSGRSAQVTEGRALKVTTVQPSARELSPAELARFQYFSLYFSRRDAPTDFDLNVDGSVTPVDFRVQRQPEQVLYIKRVRFVFHDEQMDISGGEARRFASAAAPPGLTNGIEFFTDQVGERVDIFNEPVKQMADFWQYADDFTAVTGALGAGEDFLSWDIVFEQPVVITQGSIDRVSIIVNDDLTNINRLRVIASGYREVTPD